MMQQLTGGSWLCLGLVFVATVFRTAQTTQPVRLTRGSHPWEGYLEVYYSGRWGTVCDDGFTQTNAEVVCRQLGYTGGGAPSWRGSGSRYGLTIWLDEVRCSGHEAGIGDCGHNSWGNNDCSDENVRITCKPGVCQQHESDGSSLCYNGGHCVSQGSSYHCECPSTVSGTHCESDIDECQDNNGGCSHLCTNFNQTGYNCSCPDDELELAPDQHTCYSPSAGITCTTEGMSVTLNRAGLAGLRAEYVQVDGAGCPAVNTPSHIVFNLPLNDCGTVRRAEGDEWVYENHITSRPVTIAGLVSPVRKMNVTVRCRYPQHVHVHQSYNVHSEELAFHQDMNGQFPVKLDLEHGGHVYHPGGAALVVDPGAPLSIHFSLDNSHPELEVFTQDCMATPTNNISDPNAQYRILQDGCVVDSTLQDNKNGSEELLTLQAFRFVGQSGTVFMHCDVIICNTTDPTSRCHQGCLQPSTRRSDPSAFTFLEQRHVSLGPLHVQQCQAEGEEGEGEEEEIS